MWMWNNTPSLHLAPRSLKPHPFYARRHRRNHNLVFPHRSGSSIMVALFLRRSEYLRPVGTHCQINSIRSVHVLLAFNTVFFFSSSSNAPTSPPVEAKDAIAAAKKLTALSNVAVVSRRRSQASVLGYLISGAMRRRREAQRRVMQWCVETRMGVLVKEGGGGLEDGLLGLYC